MAFATQWLSEQDVVAALDLTGAIRALRTGFAHEGTGRAAALPKTMLHFAGRSTLHALGAALPEEHLVGTKTWTHTPGGADPALLLFDAETGALLAVIEAFALGQLRTAATAAIATDLLARTDASRLAVIGTGKQALAQVAAVAQVRAVKEIRAHSPNPDHRAAFAGLVESELGVTCSPAGSAAEAVDGADIVTLVTRATAPVLTDSMVTEGMHVNAVGAIDLERCEFEPSILGRCGTVVTDSDADVRLRSSEFRDHFGADEARWRTVRTLGEMVASGPRERDPAEITLFKGMGSGIEDVALGAAVLAAAGLQKPGVVINRAGRARIDFATIDRDPK
ncbi:MAG: ornithine cyclodeaminase family protein [Streptosporangiaceae bacterium]